MANRETLSTLDEVKLGDKLHRSNENVCYRGEFRGKPVVVKKVILSRPESLVKFKDETEILCRPELAEAVVAPTAIVRAAPHYSIILPFMEHGSVNQILARCSLPLELVLCLAADSAKALRSVHQAGLIHRDMKSANLLVDENWRTWITDLGSAERAFDDDGNVYVPKLDTENLSQPSGGFFKRTMEGTTLGYTAPEILRNSPAVQASDVYGLGMTIAEMLTGIVPYQGMEKEDADMHTVMDASYSEHALIQAIVVDHLRPGLVSASEREGMPMALIELIRAMWHHDISARPSSAECVAALEKIAADIGVDLVDGAARAKYAENVQVPEDGASKEALLGQRAVSDGDVAMSVDKYAVHDVATVPLDIVEPIEGTSAGQQVKFNLALPIGAFATSGRRGADKMEDRFSVSHFALGGTRGELSVATVFDGHGGPACAHFVNQTLSVKIGTMLATNPEISQEERAKLVSAAFVEADATFRSKFPNEKSGCTAMAIVLWHPDRVNHPSKIRALIANAGDCRAVLCHTEGTQDKAVRLSRDHNASCPQEQERIRGCGGSISRTQDGKLRVQGHIQVTRAMGDAAMKPFGVTAEPEILEYDMDTNNGDEFMLAATDGVWDTLSDQEAVNMVRSTAKECGLAAKRVGGEALARGSSDNITCICIFLHPFDQTQDVTYVN
eukprot:CAMPEP_0184545138 /NCGR_PEP_ID=MMETSP0199_2-20130426/4094_1 /TAXON_ID=1112570 /ORGANISM="Thraustochytrium sp., Strain LLF1b" /LENGTH=671 /DNA_ID=CAMNT_0026939401 /DNA_START=83 /DNA_END=2098 /DNA_ORIENTATION=+